MKLTAEQTAALEALENSPTDDFLALTQKAGLDPNHDFVGADLRGVDFGESDLSGFDFTGADLTEARLDRADISRAKLISSTLTGASLPGLKLSQGQIEAILAVTEHLRTGRRRALVALPTGFGAVRIIASLVQFLQDQAPGHGGLILCSSRASCEQLPLLLARIGMTSIIRPGKDDQFEPRPEWRIITYREFHKRFPLVTNEPTDPSLLSGPLVLTEADHLSFKELSPILALFEERAQVAFISGQTPRSKRVEQHFGPDFVFQVTLNTALEEGALRPSVTLNRTAIAGRFPDRGELDMDAVEACAADFVAVLARQGLMLSKSVFICASQQQAFSAQRAIEAMYRNMLTTEVIEGEPPLGFAGVPQSTAQMRDWMDDVGGSPRVICCRPTMVGEAFERSPDAVGLILRGLSGRTRALFERARATADDPGRPVVVADYTGAV